MTYDGYPRGGRARCCFRLRPRPNVRSYITFPGEAVDNTICVDERNGVYVVTSKRMLRLQWTGEKLSTDEADGAWQLPYESSDPEKAMAPRRHLSRVGHDPIADGFGDDPDKFVVIADAAEAGTNLVAFWREAIPDGFEQKPGTLSRRIADQIQIDISTLTIEPSAECPRLWRRRDQRELSGSAATPWSSECLYRRRDATRALGVQKFVWNPN